MKSHGLELTEQNLLVLGTAMNGRILTYTKQGLDVFVYNPVNEPAGPGSNRVHIPIDDAMAERLREQGSVFYRTPDGQHEFQIQLRD